MKHLLVQSHRGGGADAPENTIEAFTAAWNLGAVPEADLRTTRDGVIVAFHDATFARVVKDLPPELRDKGVQDVTFEQLSALDVGSSKDDTFAGQRVCRVEEPFCLMQERPARLLYLDIKDVQLPRLADLVRAFDVAGQVILAAPNEQLLRSWRQLVPQSQTLLWMGMGGEGGEARLRQRLQSLREEAFAGIIQLQLHVEVIQRDDTWQFAPSLDVLRQTADALAVFKVVFQALTLGVRRPGGLPRAGGRRRAIICQ